MGSSKVDYIKIGLRYPIKVIVNSTDYLLTKHNSSAMPQLAAGGRFDPHHHDYSPA